MKTYLVVCGVQADVADDATPEQERLAITTALGPLAAPLVVMPDLPAESVPCHERGGATINFGLQLALQLVPELAGIVAVPLWRLRSQDLPYQIVAMDPDVHPDAGHMLRVHALADCLQRSSADFVQLLTQLRQQLAAPAPGA